MRTQAVDADFKPAVQPDGFFFDFAARGAMLTVSLSIRRDQCTRGGAEPTAAQQTRKAGEE
jgi:hypothetical protein